MHRFQQSLLRLLRRLHRHRPDGLQVAEVGVFRGETTAILLERCPFIKRLTAVDIVVSDAAIERLTPHNQRVEWLRMPSVEAAKLVGEHDFVFIDADHSYEAVADDIRAWRPKVSAGGILCGHDYRRWAVGVRRAVDELLPEKEIWGGGVWVLTNDYRCL